MTNEILGKWEQSFDEKYPAFRGVGAPFPMFTNTPNRNHIKQFISKAISQSTLQVREELIKGIEEAIGSDDAGFEMPKDKQIYRNNLRSEIKSKLRELGI